jgi:hypothetical protein
MSTDYLKKVLKAQTFAPGDKELLDLNTKLRDVENLLLENFRESPPTITKAGSLAKRTMIKESYDGDLTCYFLHENDEAGSTLEEIYNNVKGALDKEYFVEVKTSALRIRGKDDSSDLHIDVVPGRYTDDSSDDVFLHRTSGDKTRLKTNLQVHVEHIRDSGVTDAIKLMKYWKVRNGIEAAKTFVLELLVVKLLEGKHSLAITEQLKHVWTQFRDHSASLSVEDPANSNNDLKAALDGCRGTLSAVASNTLWQIDNNGWENVFGAHETSDSNSLSYQSAVEVVRQQGTATKPWCKG